MGDIEHNERWTIWSLPGTRGQRVVAVDGRVPEARERIDVVPAEQLRGAVEENRRLNDLLNDEINAKARFAREAEELRAELASLTDTGGW